MQADTQKTEADLLQARDLRKVYQQGEESLEILKGVSLSVKAGESVAIMGRSGSGKSTLISLLAGLDRPSEGEINLEGQRLDAMNAGDLNAFRAKKIGIVFQQFHLLDHLTAYENVRLPLDLNRESRAEERARSVLGKVGLGHRVDHFPDQLSRGECQRVAIARVLVMHPVLLLADEPTGSLDVRTGREIMELIFELSREQKVALLVATHDPKLAERFDRRLYVEEGTLTTERPASMAF